VAIGADTTDAFRNKILSTLTPDSVEALGLKRVELPLKKVLYEPDMPIETVYFPEAGVASVVSLMSNGGTAEVGTFGREGMAGSVLLLGTISSPFRYFMQLEGHGYQASAERFKLAATRNDNVRETVLRYESLFRLQTMQGMACNALHSVEQRCCRWILMTRDRVDTDDFKLTHEFLAVMLGVRRATVTEVLSPLRELNLLRSDRGTISILDRKSLEVRTCECYAIIRNREREWFQSNENELR
jgi:CRP-like cAMP-binding protein